MPARDNVVKHVKSALMTRPYILESMRLGIVNYSALARLLHSEVERLSGRKLTQLSVKMAVLRASKELLEEGATARKLALALVGSEIKLVGGLGVLSVDPSKANVIFSSLSSRPSSEEYVQLVRGSSALTLIGSEEFLERIYSSIEKSNVKQFLRRQSAIIVTGPPDILVTPGVVSVVSMALSVRGINLTEVVSSYRDIIFILSSDEAPKAYNILRDLVSSLKSLL
ncbi:MAG: ACT domain-containing protein [Infirmifilum sp.]